LTDCFFNENGLYSGMRGLPQSSLRSASSLGEGAFWSSSLLQYEASSKRTNKHWYRQRLPPRGSWIRRKAMTEEVKALSED